MKPLRSAIALATLAATTTALADGPPSRWEAVKDPAAADAYALHVEVQRRLAQRNSFDVGESQALAAKAKLERANAATSPDVRLRFDLGLVYFVLQDHERAAKVLSAALAAAPDHPAAEEAWLRLAFACGHVGDHACERRAYLEVLRQVTEEPQRATPTLNLAETEMHLGNLKEAVEGYREALRLASRTHLSRDTAPLAVWGLAVALDRTGDRVSAEKEARFAMELESSSGQRNILHSTNVFFVPAYEREWYDGLGATAAARVEPSATKAAVLWKQAEQHFEAYVKAAEKADAGIGRRDAPAAEKDKLREKDRWLDMARARLVTIKTERAKAEKRRAKEPAREPETTDDGETPL